MTQADRYDFSTHLANFGPELLQTRRDAVSPEEARRYTIALARQHYENFPVLGWLVPGRLTAHFAAVYAFCRWADDLGDEVGDSNRSLFLLDWWKDQVHEMYAGRAKHPVLIALSETIDHFAIPPQPWLDLISAFRQDQLQSRYSTVAELLDYCRRSANPVGRIVLHLTSRHAPEHVEWSDSICTGLQLANFCQDVSTDFFEKGRIYLPLSERERHGVTEESLRQRLCNLSFVDMMKEEVDRAETFLRAGLPLSRAMPGRFKVLVAAFAEGGLAILRRIRAIEYNVLAARPRLSRLDRFGALARAFIGLVGRPSDRKNSSRGATAPLGNTAGNVP